MKTPAHSYNKNCYCNQCLEQRLRDDLLTIIAKQINYLQIRYGYENIEHQILDRFKALSFNALSTKELEKIVVSLTERIEEERELKELAKV